MSNKNGCTVSLSPLGRSSGEVVDEAENMEVTVKWRNKLYSYEYKFTNKRLEHSPGRLLMDSVKHAAERCMGDALVAEELYLEEELYRFTGYLED